tara:strand:+ start:602 stop:832 length:231 start_codon:yes stop_codon:yes gene_type:complete
MIDRDHHWLQTATDEELEEFWAEEQKIEDEEEERSIAQAEDAEIERQIEQAEEDKAIADAEEAEIERQIEQAEEDK